MRGGIKFRKMLDLNIHESAGDYTRQASYHAYSKIFPVHYFNFFADLSMCFLGRKHHI